MFAPNASETVLTRYSLADVNDHISAIMDEALAGETIIIVREGTPVLELRRTVPEPTRSDLARVLDEVAQETRDLPSLGPSVADFVREMRDGVGDAIVQF